MKSTEKIEMVPLLKSQSFDNEIHQAQQLLVSFSFDNCFEILN